MRVSGIHERWNRESEISHCLESAATYESKHGTNPHISLPTAVMTRPSNPWTLPGLGLLINSTYAIHDLSLAFNDLDLGSRIPTTYSGTEAGPLSCRNRNRQSRFFCSRVCTRIRLPPPRLNIGPRRHGLTIYFNLSIRRDGTSSMYGT